MAFQGPETGTGITSHRLVLKKEEEQEEEYDELNYEKEEEEEEPEDKNETKWANLVRR